MARTIEHIQEPADKASSEAVSWITKNFFVIAIVLALVAAGISFLLFQQLQQARSEMSKFNDMSSADLPGKITRLNEQMVSMATEQKAFQAQLMTEQENFHSTARKRRAETEAMSRKLEISNQQLLQSMDVLFKQKGREHIGWVLSEVEYLLLIANHSLQLQGNVKMASIALQLADERLLDSGDPGAIDIRTQINEEIEQLKALDQIDIVQLAAKLSGSIKMINQLPVNYTQSGSKEKVDQLAENKTVAVAEAGKVEQASKEFLEELKKLIILRQRNKPAQPMITPKEQFFLKQNLQLKLETARYALLSGKQELYTDSIRDAIDWLETYYDSEVRQVSFMIAELKSLLKKNIITPVLPNISHSINLLRAYQIEIGKKPQPVTNDTALKDEVK
jgi:uroporphyrin-3 C-methyltransferase